MATSVTILGSTGVVGKHTLEVIDSLPDMEVVCLSAGRNVPVLVEQIRKYRPQYVSVLDDVVRAELFEALSGDSCPEIGVGEEGLVVAGQVHSDIVISAIVGAAGLIPTWEAVKRGARIGLANKETMVAAGDLIMPLVECHGATIVPVDSEHSALFQCLQGESKTRVRRYILTASGGPFRTWSREQIERATVKDALNHPNWTMGQKITIDSATLMNKGLEVIEAHHLFQAPYDKIEVLVHPQSVVHSMIEYEDGAVMAQMATPDMRLPIAYALTYPSREQAAWPSLNLVGRELTFELPDTEKFRSLSLAYEAGIAGGFAPCILNAANEVAVQAFLEYKLGFSEIPILVEMVLNDLAGGAPSSLSDIFSMDKDVRVQARLRIEKGGWSR